METLTGKKVYIVKANLGATNGIIGVFDNEDGAEKLAQQKYRAWTNKTDFEWKKGKTAQEVNIESNSQSLDLNGSIIIKVCSAENPGFKSRNECRLKQTD